MKAAALYSPLASLDSLYAKLLACVTAISQWTAADCSANIIVCTMPMGVTGWPFVDPMILIEQPTSAHNLHAE